LTSLQVCLDGIRLLRSGGYNRPWFIGIIADNVVFDKCARATLSSVADTACMTPADAGPKTRTLVPRYQVILLALLDLLEVARHFEHFVADGIGRN
jgi:hypothetical protein